MNEARRGNGRIRRRGPALAGALLLTLWGVQTAAQQPTEQTAQDTVQETASTPEDVDALIQRVQEQIDRMTAATAERDQALKFLEQQIEAAAGALSSTGETAESLRSKAAELSTTVETLAQDRDTLVTRLETVEDERDRRIRELEQSIARLNTVLGQTTTQVASLETDLGTTRQTLDASRTRVANLESALADRDAQLGDLQGRVAAQSEALQTRADEVARLKDQLGRAAQTLGALEGQIGENYVVIDRQRAEIDRLGAQLSQALAAKVEELSQYRSDFFGRLRQVLGDRPELRIVGDRFVFQSELLFASGSASLGEEGRAQLRELASTLKEVAPTIPPDIDWILRVDGHTDRQPLRPDASFASNWELSTARAIAVVEFLIGEGIPPERLAATGFGQYQPLEEGDNPIAYSRNRRIEFKLTEG
jgi:chemotaxis protein MotB